MHTAVRIAAPVLALAALAGAALSAPPARAQEREAPRSRPITIRWSAVKRVSQADRSFTVERATGRDGERPSRVETAVITGKATEFAHPPREGQAAPPAAGFDDVVVGARVQVTGVLSPDGRVQATRVLISPPRAPAEGRKPAEEPKP